MLRTATLSGLGKAFQQLRAGQGPGVCPSSRNKQDNVSIHPKHSQCMGMQPRGAVWSKVQMLPSYPDKINSSAPQQSDLSSPLLTPNLSGVKRAKVHTH